MRIFNHISDIEGRGEENIISSGFQNLDASITGFRYKETVLIASTPTIGKTAFMVNLALKIAQQNYTTVFITYETTQQAIYNKLLGILSDLDPFLIQTGKVEGEAQEIVKMAEEELRKMDIFLTDSFTMKGELLMQGLEELDKIQPDAVFIDSLQFVQYSNLSEPDVRDIDNMLFLKNLAREYNFVLFVSTQIKAKGLKGKKPVIQDIGGVEELADMVLLLDRPFAYSVDGYVGMYEKFTVQVAKNRSGPTGNFDFTFNRRSLRIKEAREI